MLGELGTILEVRRAGRVTSPPAARPVPVMLLPGFGTHPVRMKRLRLGLEASGHRVYDWGLGFNLGADEDRFTRLVERIETIARREGAPLVLVGWSLGGLYAREAAKQAPDGVAMVVTLGSPFSGGLHDNNAWRAYQAIAGHAVEEAPFGYQLAEKPPVPTVAIWSPRDGIVAPRCARGKAGERDLALAVRCTHLGMAGHPAVTAAVLELIGRLEEFRSA